MNYECRDCGTSGVRLYRKYSILADHVVLRCRACSLKNQNRSMPDDPSEHTIGWLVAAVPTPDCKSFWGFTSVPEDRVAWWDDLPREAPLTATKRGLT